MGVKALVPVEEYLRSSYDPDVEYVDGVLVERNAGDWLHSLVQSNIIFGLRRKYPSIKVVPELRGKVRETRYRLPDVSVLLRAPQTKVLLEAPFIAIEILTVFLLRAIANFAEDYLSAFIGQKVVLDLRSDLNNHLQRLSLSFFNRTPTGVMMSRDQ